jgi:hypothetical protein
MKAVARLTRTLLLTLTVALPLAGCSATKASTNSSGSSPSSGSTHGPGSGSSNAEEDLSGPGSPTVPGSVVPHGAGTATGQSACRPGDPLANVYHPNRLTVLNPCMTVSGTVASVTPENDGDTHFDLALDPQYKGLLRPANYAAQHGRLVVEIVPADKPGCTPGQPPRPATGSYNYGICTGADETSPALGSHAYVTGPYVTDEDHGGWAEVHPAWAISATPPTPAPTTTTSGPQVIQASPPSTTVPPPAASASPPAATTPPTSPPSSAASCQATASPSNDGYPGDYEVFIHSNQPNQEATASDAGDTWSHETDSSGYTDIRLFRTSPGEAISVTVGAASCPTTA